MTYLRAIANRFAMTSQTSVILALICLALAWLLPNHYPPWTSFYNDSSAAMALAILAATVFTRATQALPRAVWLVVVIAAIPWIQFGAGLFPYIGDAWLASLYLCGFAVAIAVGYSAAAQSRQAFSQSLAWACFAASLVSSVLAIAQAFQIEGLGIWVVDSFPGMRPYANLAQPNNLATLIGMGLVALWLLRERGVLGSLAGASALIPLMAGLALTQSRTALLYLPLAIGVLLLQRRRGANGNTRLSTIAALALTHVALTYLWPLAQEYLLMTATASLQQREAGSIRFLVWPVLFDALSTRPMTGFGWLQIGAAELSAADRHPPATELYLQAHNVILDLALSCGLPVAAAICAFTAYWFVSRMTHLKTDGSAAGMAIVCMFGLHAMLELPHYYAYFLIPVGLWVGIVEFDGNAATSLSVRWMWPVCALGVAGTLIIWSDYLRVEEEFRNVRFEAARIGTVPAATPLRPNPALSSLLAFLEHARQVPRPSMSENELDAMRHSVERYPYAGSLKRYSIALLLNGRQEEAKQLFQKIRQIYGPTTYKVARQELRNEIAQGKRELLPLEQSLSD